MEKYQQATKLLDYQHHSIQSLIARKGWESLDEAEQIAAVYNFVRDEIKFGYNSNDAIPASQVLQDGYGQCNTKASLFMALLRALKIPNRLHGFTIDKALQKGALSGLWYRLSPPNILHSWVEVYYDGQWYALEGLILDKPYLSALQTRFAGYKTTFCGYGVYTDNFQNPPIEWQVNDTYIQRKGINQDFGLFDSPDAFYRQQQQELKPLKRWIFKHWVRHIMNRKVEAIRGGKVSD